MNRLFPILILAAACGAPVPADAPAPRGAPTQAPEQAPRPVGPPGVILFIGDGTGLEYWNAAKLAATEPLAIESLPVIGLMDTESTDSRTTDSAAGATALASGVRTYNGAIGLAPDSTPVETVLELAIRQGWATGLIATSNVTHATPAAFAAHQPSRQMYEAIAADMADRRIDVLLGGGRDHFRAVTREDGRDLMARLRDGRAYVEDAAAFRSLDMDTVRALVGLFADNHPEPAPARAPDLSELTAGALAVLEQDPEGFFLMVEGSQIDWRGHDNAPIDEVIAEVRDFDDAIRAALRFQERRPNTLIVVTADHSTGGLVIHSDPTGAITAHYTTTGHTAGMVPLFARGPGAAAFGGIRDNDHVGRLLLQVVREGGVVAAPER